MLTVAFSPDSRTALSAASNDLIDLWDLTDREAGALRSIQARL